MFYLALSAPSLRGRGDLRAEASVSLVLSSALGAL